MKSDNEIGQVPPDIGRGRLTFQTYCVDSMSIHRGDENIITRTPILGDEVADGLGLDFDGDIDAHGNFWLHGEIVKPRNEI